MGAQRTEILLGGRPTDNLAPSTTDLLPHRRNQTQILPKKNKLSIKNKFERKTSCF